MSEITEFAETLDCVCERVRRTGRAVTQHYEDCFRGSGLRSTQFIVLATLLQTGPMSVSRLAERLGVERTTLTRNLTPLTKRGLVRTSGTIDARFRVEEITPAGLELARELLPRWREAQASVGSLLADLRISLG